MAWRFYAIELTGHWLIPHRQHNKMHGSGTFTFANGNEYVGEFVEDAKEGRGSLQYIDGERYDGEWYGDKQHGQGTLTYASGDRYVGQWKDGNKDGEGTLQYANGDRYEGMWRKDAAHGRGTLQYTTGDVYEGDWKDNLRHGSGHLHLCRGWQNATGEFADGLKHGRGTLTLPSGDSITGNWDRGHVSGGGGVLHAPDSAWGIRRSLVLFCSRVAAGVRLASQCDDATPSTTPSTRRARRRLNAVGRAIPLTRLPVRHIDAGEPFPRVVEPRACRRAFQDTPRLGGVERAGRARQRERVQFPPRCREIRKCSGQSQHGRLQGGPRILRPEPQHGITLGVLQFFESL